MDSIKEDSLQPFVIDLHAAKRNNINESYLAAMGSKIRLMLMQMFPGRSTLDLPVTIRGTKPEIKTFAKALEGEKRYMNAYLRYGLDDPRTYKNRYRLERSVKDFEKITGLKWPIK